MKSTITAIFSIIALSSCMSAPQHRGTGDESVDRLTVGTAQREIRVGMTAGEIIEVLGSANVVSIDGEGREIWIYDRVASDCVLSGSHAEASTSQRNQALIIKFGDAGPVRDIACRSPNFLTY